MLPEFQAEMSEPGIIFLTSLSSFLGPTFISDLSIFPTHLKSLTQLQLPMVDMPPGCPSEQVKSSQ